MHQLVIVRRRRTGYSPRISGPVGLLSSLEEETPCHGQQRQAEKPECSPYLIDSRPTPNALGASTTDGDSQGQALKARDRSKARNIEYRLRELEARCDGCRDGRPMMGGLGVWSNPSKEVG
jgi:hypothetical protein